MRSGRKMVLRRLQHDRVEFVECHAAASAAGSAQSSLLHYMTINVLDNRHLPLFTGMPHV
jgi:hypothetical protein